MKKLLLVLLMIPLANAYSQGIDIGVKAGLDYGQSVIVHSISSNGMNFDSIQSGSSSGFVAGAYGRVTFGKWLFQPEILFTSSNQGVSGTGTGQPGLLNIHINKVDFPLVFGYNLFSSFHVTAGPVISHLHIDSDEHLIQFNNLTLAYQAGLGLDILKFSFDARYEGNMLHLRNTFDGDNTDLSVNAEENIFQFTIGYKIF